MKFLPVPLLLLSLLLPMAALAEKETEEKAVEVRPEIPHPDEVLSAMKRATSFFRSLSFAGGYAWEWPADLEEARGENHSSGSLIMIQPPGTPAVGLAMLEAWRATGDPLFLQGAREAADALLWCQLASGGWNSDHDFNPQSSSRQHYRRDVEAGDLDPGKRHAVSTLDDNKTQSALFFLLEMAQEPELANDERLHRGLKFGMDGLLAAQAPNGGWPQRYRGPSDPDLPVMEATIPETWSRTLPEDHRYNSLYTLNDGNIEEVVRLLLRGHELTGDSRYLDSAIQSGEFLLLAQLPEPQPAWAQQYDHQMVPAWARKFEPPAVSSVESVGALRALTELWLATGEERFREPLEPALRWLRKVRLEDGSWARFYELGTNRPLYMTADTYEVTYDDSNLPTHYGFKIPGKMERRLDSLERSREDLLDDREPPGSAAGWARFAARESDKVWQVMDALDERGRWLSEDDIIEARTFVSNLRTMARWMDAVREGGQEFEKLREKAVEDAEKKKEAGES